jgi:hypothetical protein
MHTGVQKGTKQAEGEDDGFGTVAVPSCSKGEIVAARLSALCT